MHVFIIYVLLTISLLNSVDPTELNGSCVTPNGENATCIPLDSCVVINRVIATGDNNALQFFGQSQCGYTDAPLICCGRQGYYEKFKQTGSNSLPGIDICGISTVDDKIVGGKLTKIKEFPWMALLGYSDGTSVDFNCAGTLINSRYVLTAAHCLRKTQNKKTLTVVRLGEWRVSTTEDCEHEDLAIPSCADPVVNLKIEQQKPHEGYSRRQKNHDIALLRLEKDVTFTKYIRPICLPSLNEEIPNVGGSSIVAGWGTIENDSLSDIMLKAPLEVLTPNACVEKLRRFGEISENQFCAGGRRGVDACPGDSGGPLMRALDGSKRKWYQDGIISWGIGCGGPYPGVYTRVSKYINWILENMS